MAETIGFARWVLVLALCTLFSPAVPAAAEIGSNAFAVEVNGYGLLTRVPAGGLRTVDGPRVELADGFAEWFGVTYRAGSDRVEAAGSGGWADWADRQPAELLGFRVEAGTATSVTRAGALEILTHLEFNDSRYLLVRVTLTNRGDRTLRDILYTREWRQEGGAGWTFPGDIRGLRPVEEGIRRHVWDLGSLMPGASTGLTFSYEPRGDSPADSDPEVPLSLWTDDDHPDGVPIGVSLGVSWGDYDADGRIDIFSCHSGNLWRNVDGSTWEFAADLDSTMPPTERRYGSSFGDYNNDGLPDIGTEPRVPFWGDDTMHLLRNLGGGPYFVDVATDPTIVDVQPYQNGETLCWGDVNGDLNLDAFLPVYPPWVSGPGNFFLFNLGPLGPAGTYRFTEMSGPAGLDNPPPDTARPEGAQFCDVDSDGDIDLYSNGTLYQNVSSPTTPLFNPMTESASGIGLRTSLDEGAMLFDYDLDGDQDLFIVYTADGVRIWESYGDGTFFAPDPEIVDDRFTGLNLGMSAEDWDNDGDIDFTTRQVFRRNRLMEDGARHFTVATNTIPASHLTSATPAWGDWDGDGDLDCALGNWGAEAHFYENTTYSSQTPQADRRHLRIRAVNDSLDVPAGLETAYGASVEVHLLNGADGFRRRKFVASSHGYLNQNEYTLHYALPGDPEAGDPAEDHHFDVTVDFPDLPERGLWRVDKHVNPALGDVNLAQLENREIRVHRCGSVAVDGVPQYPYPFASARLTTTTGGLALASGTVPLPPPAAAPGPDWFTGLAFDTLDATGPIRVTEIILDGRLDTAAGCGPDPFNIALWDVTDPGSAFIVAGGAIGESTSPRNRRSYFRTNIVLDPGRFYRLVARVLESRATTIDAPVDNGPVTVLGGIGYTDGAPCDGAAVSAAAVDPTTTSVALRFGDVAPSNELDPVGSTLLLTKDLTLVPVLEWQDVSADAYHVLRCDAASGPCVPSFHAATPLSAFKDRSVLGNPADLLWYKAQAVNECAAGL